MKSCSGKSVLGIVFLLAIAGRTHAQDAQPKNQQPSPFLGVATIPIPDALIAHLAPAIPPDTGRMIQSVYPNSAADQAGLQKYDLLLRCDDDPITGARQFAERIEKAGIGTEVSLTLIRRGKPQTVKVTLQERPESNVHVKQQRLTLTQDGAVKLDIQGKNRDGSKASYSLQGSIDSVRDSLPQDVAGRVQRSLEDAESALARAPRLQFRLQPSQMGQERLLRVTVSRRDDAETVHYFEIDLPVADGKPLDQLQDNTDFQGELKKMPPEVRQRIEATIERLQKAGVRQQESALPKP